MEILDDTSKNMKQHHVLGSKKNISSFYTNIVLFKPEHLLKIVSNIR